jgi:hypothetical protein
MRHFFQIKSRHVIGELRAWDNTSESDSVEAYMTPSAMIFGTWVELLCGLAGAGGFIEKVWFPSN